jgi:outer membrane protein
MTFIRKITLCATAALLASGVAQAQSAGTFIGRIGVTNITPSPISGDLSAPSFPGTKTEISSDTQPTAGVTYMVTDNIAIDVPLALGFKHTLTGAGAIEGVGKVGEIKSLPVTVLVQYRFDEAKAKIRPYVGAGLTYAKFYGGRTTAALTGLTGGSPSNPTTMSANSKFTVSFQMGVSVILSDKTGLDVSVIKTPLTSKTSLSTGQTVTAKLNPLAISVGITRQF